MRVVDADGSIPEVKGVFDFSIRAQEVGWAKPDVRIFQAAIESSGVDPHETLFVGDDFAKDIVGAKRVGMVAAWVTSTPVIPEGSEAVPDIIGKSMVAIMKEHVLPAKQM